jgi:lipoate-protein ligase A
VHGTLLYNTDFDALEEAIRPPVEKLQRHGVASVRQRVGNLKDHLTQTSITSVEELEQFIINYFCDEEKVLPPETTAQIEALADGFEQFEL